VKKGKLILLIIVVALLGVAFYGWKEYHRQHPDTATIAAAFSVKAPDMLKAFQDDENMANHRYNDKVVAVSGTVLKIEHNDSTQTVWLDGKSPMGGIICQFERSHKEELEKLQPGQPVTIKGVCTGMLMDVVLVRCALDNPTQ
jgi:hypothetical protein